MSNKNIAILVLVVALLGYAVGRYLQPAEVQIKTEVVTKEVEVIKRDVIVKEREVKRPDGTVEIDRTITDKSVETSTKDSKATSEKTVKNLKPQWKVSGLAIKKNDERDLVYGAQVERRILGPIFLGVSANADKDIGLIIGLEF